GQIIFDTKHLAAAGWRRIDELQPDDNNKYEFKSQKKSFASCELRYHTISNDNHRGQFHLPVFHAMPFPRQSCLLLLRRTLPSRSLARPAICLP
ncbi:hypothetical protein ABTB62_19280, partial [Acinetobacter baumannii]